jgi:hypothetical protein
MSARRSCATTVNLPLATSCAISAAVSRPRESIQYSVLPSVVKPRGPVVCESSRPTSTTGLASTLPSATR